MFASVFQFTKNLMTNLKNYLCVLQFILHDAVRLHTVDIIVALKSLRHQMIFHIIIGFCKDCLRFQLLEVEEMFGMKPTQNRACIMHNRCGVGCFNKDCIIDK